METAILISEIYNNIRILKSNLEDYKLLNDFLNSGIQLHGIFEEALRSANSAELNLQLQKAEYLVYQTDLLKIQLKQLLEDAEISKLLQEVQAQFKTLSTLTQYGH